MRFLRSFAAAAVVAAFMGAAVASPVVQEGTGVGKHGDVKVAVTFDNGKIQDIKVLSQKENPVLAQRVFKDLRQEVIDTNSVDVDVISGASFSSKGLLDAVSDAAKKAGVKLSKAGKKSLKKASMAIPRESTYDVVVIGAGGAGFSARPWSASRPAGSTGPPWLPASAVRPSF